MLPEDYRTSRKVTLDIVIPVYNEKDDIGPLIDRLDKVFSDEGRKKYGISRVNYIFVDDNSADNSPALIKQKFIAKPDIRARVILLSRNFGQQPAVSCGIDNSNSDLTAIIDADLQDPPELITQMIDKWREGYDVVYGQRVNRKENIIKRFFYWFFYRIYHFLSPIDVAVDSGDFCLLGRKVIDEIKKLPESIRFPRGLRSWVGFSQIGIPYDRPERARGKTKYTFSKLYQLATDGITSISIKPLKLAQFFALIYLFGSLAILSFIGMSIKNYTSSDKNFLILLIVMLLSNSTVLLCIYVLGAYVGRGYLESKRRPNYIIKDIMELSAKSGNE